MHKDDRWQLYGRNGEPISGAWWDPESDRERGEEEIIGVVEVFLYRFREGKLEFLWQRRSEAVDFYAGDYDYAAGGHVNLGESLVEAVVREAKEEIGAEVLPEELEFIATAGYRNKRFMWIFVADWTNKTEDFDFSDGEVSEVRWVPYAEMEDFRKKYAKEPIKNDDLTFLVLDKWLKGRGLVEDGDF